MAVEEELCRWCLMELELDDDALRQLFAVAREHADDDSLTGESLDNRVDRESYNKTWCRWAGREHEFFLACARLVEVLSWRDVIKISGPEVRALARLTQQAYRQLTTDETAPALIIGAMQLVQIAHKVARVTTYSEYDPVEIPRQMLDLLPYFDRRPTAEALATIESEEGMRVDPALVRKLTDFALLVPPE